MTLDDIVNEAKKSGNGVSEMNMFKELIRMLFDDEISASQGTIDNIEKNYREKLDWKNESQEYYRNAKEYQDGIIQELNTVLVKSYNEVMNAAKKIGDASLNSLNKFCDFINTMYSWDNTDHECWDNTLTPKIDNANRQYSSCCDKHNSAINYEYYYEDYRKDLVKRVNEEENLVVSRMKEYYEEACKDCENALESKTREQIIIKDMQEYRNVFMNALDLGIRQYQQQNKATTVHNEEYIVPNVFDCIKKEDYKLFLHSFEDGVDISVCNADGYNPLTLAVYTGNNMMVQFLLDHGADASLKDKRGYNAFHTAVENQYRDICKMLLDVDPELIDTKTASGESVETLAKKQTFTKWIENEINNSF